MENSKTYVTAETSVSDVINNPAFDGFGQFIFPIKTKTNYDPNMRISNISSLLPYHNPASINTDSTVNVINYMLDEVNNGRKIFYNFYTEPQKLDDPAKKSTGLFFFRGKENAPFALICAGGGFNYVGSIHGSYPIALELSKNGYNAFALEYRTGGERFATEDLAAALSYIFASARIFNVDTKNYSVWGGSAGAKMAANIASYGAVTFGGANIPRPSLMVIAYGNFGFTKNDPPAFALVSEDDSFHPGMTMIVEKLRKDGIEVEYHTYKKAGHGFGLGIGSEAEGWINNAMQFWKKSSPPAVDTEYYKIKEIKYE